MERPPPEPRGLVLFGNFFNFRAQNLELTQNLGIFQRLLNNRAVEVIHHFLGII